MKPDYETLYKDLSKEYYHLAELMGAPISFSHREGYYYKPREVVERVFKLLKIEEGAKKLLE